MENNHVIFYDGFCPLCQKMVRLVIKQDKHKIIRYAPLSGETAKDIIPEGLLKIDALIYKQHASFYNKSTAVILILGDLWGCFPQKLFLLFPRKIRDYLYDLAAKNRHKHLSKDTNCPLPSPDEKNLFLG